MYQEIITWAIILVMALVSETLTAGALISIWFVPGAIVGMLLALLKVPFWIQIAVWLALAIACIVLTHTVFHLSKKLTKSVKQQVLIPIRLVKKHR